LQDLQEEALAVNRGTSMRYDMVAKSCARSVAKSLYQASSHDAASQLPLMLCDWSVVSNEIESSKEWCKRWIDQQITGHPYRRHQPPTRHQN